LTALMVLSWAILLPAAVIDSFTIEGTTCTDGLCTSVPGATTITFNGLTGQSSPYSFGLAIYSWTGPGSPFVQGTVSGQYAAPPNDDSTYLAVGAGGNRPSTVSIQFGRLMGYFGFYMGSPDTYNSVMFRFSNNGETETFSGADLLDPANGNQSIGSYLNFFSSRGFDQVELISTQAAFETDNHAYAPVPEPGTLAFLGSGLILVAAGIRRFSAKPVG